MCAGADFQKYTLVVCFSVYESHVWKSHHSTTANASVNDGCAVVRYALLAVQCMVAVKPVLPGDWVWVGSVYGVLIPVL